MNVLIPPCASGMCIWNATTQGNGFIVDANDNVHYLD